MEKYGVEICKKKDQKTADEKGKCPSCGDDLVKDTPTPLCRKCGVEPFEKLESGK